MKKVFLGVVLLLMFVRLSYCQEQPLQLTIKSDKQVYEAGEEISIEAGIRNTTDSTVRIYSPDYWGASEIIVVNSKGITLKPRGMKIDRRAFDYFMAIPPRDVRTHNFENLTWFHCGGAWQFGDEAQLPADSYRIYVTVTNPPVDKCNTGKKFEKTDLLGTLTSNAITIEVEGKNGISKEEALKLVQNYIKEHNISVIDIDKPLSIKEFSRVKENDSWLIHYEYSREYQADPPPYHVFIVDKKTGEIREIPLL